MTNSTDDQLIVSGYAARALASPHRLEIIGGLGHAGPVSIAELARRLGRSPHSLYYHFRILERAGIIVRDHTRRSGRNQEQIWRLAAGRILLDHDQEDVGAAAATAGAIDSMLRLTGRELQNALMTEEEPGPGEPRRLIGERIKGRIDARTLEKINRKIEELETLIKDNDSPSGEVFSVTIVVAPSGESKRRNR